MHRSSCNIMEQSTIIDEAAKQLAKNIVSEAEKNKLPKASKLAVLYFIYNDGSSDTLKTNLGKLFAKKLETELTALKKYTIIIVDTTLETISQNTFFSTPSGDNKYWEKFLKNQTPDYFITGEFKMEDKFQTFTTQNIFLKKNITNGTQNIAVTGTSNSISKKEDRTFLLRSLQPATIEQLCMMVANEITLLTNIKNIYLKNITYKETGSATEFSDKVATMMEQQLVEVGGYAVKRGVNRGVFNKTDLTEHKLAGNYWKDGEYLQINLVLINSNDQTIRTINKKILIEYLSDTKYEVENIEAVKEQAKILTDNAILDSDFNVEIYTSKGNENPIIYEGEKIKFSVIASEACYIRLMSVLADETLVLLLDNYEITKDNTNKVYEIPKTFVCSSPFGVETLIMNAQTEVEFEEIKYEVKSGYKIITDDLAAVVKKNRGIRNDIKNSEKSVKITTLKKK